MQVLHRHRKGAGRGLGTEGLRAGLQAALRAADRYDSGALSVQTRLHAVLTTILDGEAKAFNAARGAAEHARTKGQGLGPPVRFEPRLEHYLEQGMDFDEATEQATRDVVRDRALRAEIASLAMARGAS